MSETTTSLDDWAAANAVDASTAAGLLSAVHVGLSDTIDGVSGTTAGRRLPPFHVAAIDDIGTVAMALSSEDGPEGQASLLWQPEHEPDLPVPLLEFVQRPRFLIENACPGGACPGKSGAAIEPISLSTADAP